MKFSDIREGQYLKCVGDYADCIHTGKIYEVYIEHVDGGLYVICDVGPHDLESSTDENGNIPELELV